MKKRMFALLLGALLCFGGCASQTESTTTEENTETTTEETAAADDQELTQLDLVLDWYPNAIHAFLYEAMEKGYFAEEGIELNIQFPANTNDAISLTAAGQADIGIYYLHDVIVASVNQGVPVKSIGAVCQQPLNVFVSLAEKNITSPTDLIGKKLGGSGSELNEAMVRYIIEQAGGTADDIDIVDVGFDLMSSMTTGNVDATLGCMVNHEVPQLEKEGFDVNYFYPTDFGVPNYYEMIFVTGEQQLQEEPELLKGFLRACQKGFEEMKAHPEESVDLLLTYQNADNFPLDKDVEMQSMSVLLPAMETEEAPFLSQTEEVWDTNIAWLKEIGIIDEIVPADTIMVNLLEE